MKLDKANKLVEEIIAMANKKFDVPAIVTKMKELRELALEESDPTVTKVLRLCYEYLEEHGVVDFTVEMEEDEEENEIKIENENDLDNFVYLMNLVLRSDNKYNREEMQKFRDEFKADLY
jgi:hypothetical protein